MSKSQRTKPDRTGQLEIFPTPSWPVHRLLDCLKPRGGTWLEPCAGEGHIIRAVDEWFEKNRPDDRVTWESTDIRATRYAQPPCDMTKPGHFFEGRRFAVILTNPPFSKAFEMFKLLWPMTDRALAFLLPLSWLGSGDRCTSLRENTPSVFVLPERPIFRFSGTDQETYGWLVWGRKRVLPAGTGYLHILPATPAKERRASEREAASLMPADWQREAEERKAERLAREKARREKAR